MSEQHDYRFETEDVIAAIAAPGPLKARVENHLHMMTASERRCLYRAIAHLASLGGEPGNEATHG